jgi:hypothetical protein
MMRNSHFRLSIIYAKLEDSGTYTCSTPHGQHNSLAVIVTTLSCPIIHTSHTLRGNTTDIFIGTVVAFSFPTGFVLLWEDTLKCRDDGNSEKGVKFRAMIWLNKARHYHSID